MSVPEPSADAARPGRWALCASFTEELLNDLMSVTVGDGVALAPLDTSVALPAMGEVDVRLALTITGGRFDLRADDGGRCRIVVTADGDVSTRSVAYDVGPVEEHAGPSGMPAPPAPIPVRVEALVRPFVEIRSHDEVAVGLDLADAELVSLSVDADAPHPPDVDTATWTGVLNMFSMMFGVLGAGLFDSLGEHVGSAGIELDPAVGRALEQLGVRPGRAEVSVASGLVTVGLPAEDAVEGRAWPVPVAGSRVGIGAASSVVDAATRMLLARAAGDLPMPFDLDVDLGEQQVTSRLRSSRLLPEGFPDLRSSVRTEIRPRLARGRLELVVRAAWVELPTVIGSLINPLSRRLGDLAALAPMRVRFPTELGLPIAPGGGSVPVRIDDLRIGTDGLGLVLSLP